MSSYTNNTQASTEWRPLLAAMSGGPTSTQTLKGRWRLAATAQERATLRRRHCFSHGHGLHDTGRECILTMPSIKGNISSWRRHPLQVAGDLSHDKDNNREDHQHSASPLLFLWLSRGDSEWQWSSIDLGPVCWLPETEWSQTHQVCSIPSCNQRSAERMVQVLKNSLKLASRLSFDHQLVNFLLSYQSMPHSTMGVPPAELFLKRWLRTRLTLLTPDQEANVHRK